MDDRLYRSVDDRMLAGVAGGVAERLDADPSIIRIVWAMLIVLTGGIALIAYLVMAIVVPEDPGADAFDGTGSDPDPAPWPAPGAATAAAAAGTTAAAAGTTADDGTGGPTEATSVGPADPDAPTAATAGSWLAPDGRTVARADGPPSRRDQRRQRRRQRRDERGPLVGGLILILIGGFFLLRQFVPAIDIGSWWPVILVGIGLILVIVSVTPGRRSG